MTTTMQAAQISIPGGDWEVVERVIPEPRAGHVRVKVDACGICHSDVFVKEGHWPGLAYPRVPGHEIAGHIDAVGDNVTAWNKGQRVGVGWHGGHCFVCAPCRRGDFAMCVHRQVTGFDLDGGYAEYMIARAETLAAIPDALPAEEAGPLMCAGVTVYNALRHAGARAGEVIAVHGIGGLGHLGVQYARQVGFETVAINRGNDKASLARQLGAHHDIDATAQDAVTELQKLGGARVILATAPNAPAISALIDGLSPSGTLLVLAAPAEPLTISVLALISGRRSVAGWYAGTARDAQETLEFSVLSAVHPMIEQYPLGRVAEAYEQMHSGRVRFRVVLTFDAWRIMTGLCQALDPLGIVIFGDEFGAFPHPPQFMEPPPDGPRGDCQPMFGRELGRSRRATPARTAPTIRPGWGLEQRSQ